MQEIMRLFMPFLFFPPLSLTPHSDVLLYYGTGCSTHPNTKRFLDTTEFKSIKGN